MNCTDGRHSQSQRKSIMMILVAVTVSTLLVTMSVATQQAFAAINLNSSKSNIYRSSQNAQADGGGSVEQQSTNTCDCPSDDDITNQIESNGDQAISGDDTITQTTTITTEITQSSEENCSADGEGAEVNCNISQESNGAGSPVTHGPINTSRSNIRAVR